MYHWVLYALLPTSVITSPLHLKATCNGRFPGARGRQLGDVEGRTSMAEFATVDGHLSIKLTISKSKQKEILNPLCTYKDVGNNTVHDPPLATRFVASSRTFWQQPHSTRSSMEKHFRQSFTL
ncbi:hypothetical protein Hypma_013852 [Hypsizygus marmoreus]|uniref:Secreted protein n=1 Tax=Hypsizygus marmoreus TaxID=39966 RepID=A0A369K576_HYPMA|nr:hypothetical protein Hypma_013852 [Hypsizygus marmoreus]